MAFLVVERLSKKIGEHEAINNLSFTQKKNQKIAIVGQTGAGKSTLLKTIAGLLQPDHGNVILEGKRVEGPDEKLVKGHSDIAYLSQYFELQKFLRVEQVLAYANNLEEEYSVEIIKMCRIDKLLSRRTDQLSGGEKQRVALAILLFGAPKLLLLDEPYSNLDSQSKRIMKSVIEEISDQLDITCIMVSHDPVDVLSWAETILVLKNGGIVQQGSPYEIYNQPATEYVAGLFGAFSLLPSKYWKGTLLKTNPFNSDKELFLRPENIKISQGKTENTINTIVREKRYFGGHYEVVLSINDVDLVMYTNEDVHLGDSIIVVLSIPNPWFLE